MTMEGAASPATAVGYQGTTVHTNRLATITLAFRLARRELRGGVRGLTTVLLCLALGVGVIAAVGSLRAAVDAGLAADGRRILGGDMEVDGGNTPLHACALFNKPDFAAWLIKHGARKTVKDFNGKTPLQVAEEKGNEAVAALLRKP